MLPTNSMTSWLWPDRVICKRESRELRDEHNNLVNIKNKLVEALQSLLGSPELNVDGLDDFTVNAKDAATIALESAGIVTVD